MISAEVRRLVSDISDLPSLPEVLLKTYELLESPAGTTTAIAKLLGTDPALTAQTLRWANSPLFSRGDVTDLARAVQLIGPYELILLLTSQQVASAFPRRNSAKLDMKTFWCRSLYAACSMKELAKNYGAANPNTLFISALLADIGSLLVAWYYPERFESLAPHTLDIGVALLEEWNAPEMIVDAIASPSDLMVEAISLGNKVFDHGLVSVNELVKSEIDHAYADMKALINL